MIKGLLMVNPAYRPSCDKILKLDRVMKWARIVGLDETARESEWDNTKVGEESNPELLNTIKLPKKLTMISDKLPRAQYSAKSSPTTSLSTSPRESIPKVQITEDEEIYKKPPRKSMSVVRQGGRPTDSRTKSLSRSPSDKRIHKSIDPTDLKVGGERIRNKKDPDYLETIKEDVQIGGAVLKAHHVVVKSNIVGR